jgi:hypothetical protein
MLVRDVWLLEVSRSRVASRAHLSSLSLSLSLSRVIIPCRRSFLIYTGADCGLQAASTTHSATHHFASLIVLAQAISPGPRITPSTASDAFFPSRCGLHRGLRSRRTGSFHLAVPPSRAGISGVE